MDEGKEGGFWGGDPGDSLNWVYGGDFDNFGGVPECWGCIWGVCLTFSIGPG